MNDGQIAHRTAISPPPNHSINHQFTQSPNAITQCNHPITQSPTNQSQMSRNQTAPRIGRLTMSAADPQGIYLLARLPAVISISKGHNRRWQPARSRSVGSADRTR